MYEIVPSVTPAAVRSASLRGVGDPSKSRRQLRQPEVEHLHVPAIGQEDVAGLDVAVDDPVGVRRVQRVGDLDADVDELMDLERPAVAAARAAWCP